MTFLFSLFFGAGAAAFIYAKMGRRIGFSNTQSLWLIVGAVFIITTIIFYTVLATVHNI